MKKLNLRLKKNYPQRGFQKNPGIFLQTSKDFAIFALQKFLGHEFH